MVRTTDFIKTPFSVKEKEGIYYIVFTDTNIQVSEKEFKNYESAQKWMNSKPYELISAFVSVLIMQRENKVMINEGINKNKQ